MVPMPGAVDTLSGARMSLSACDQHAASTGTDDEGEDQHQAAGAAG